MQSTVAFYLSSYTDPVARKDTTTQAQPQLLQRTFGFVEFWELNL